MLKFNPISSLDSMTSQNLKFISLFSGVGGFDLGLESAGWECVAQVEIDIRCQQVLKYHWPLIPKWQDVCDVSGYTLPVANAIVFGSPCQNLSVAGRREGLIDGEQSNLFFEATRIIQEMRNATGGIFPRFAIWENVVGSFSSNEGKDFGTVLDSLAQLGALDIGWRVLDAKGFGVPQRRRRVFVVADFGGRCGGALHSDREGLRWDSAPSAAQIATFTSRVGSGTENGSYQWTGSAKEKGIAAPLLNRLRTSDIDGGTWVIENTNIPVAFNENQRGELVETLYTRQLATGGGKPGQGYAAVREGMRLRRLTPIECERLMSWPDNFTKFGLDTKGNVVNIPETTRYKMFGNGVVSNVAWWIANQIDAELAQEARAGI